MSHTLQAGIYYIGDPCYVISAPDYEKFCNSSFNDPVFEFKGMMCFCEGTNLGDGVYTAKNLLTQEKLTKIWVDSGQIAVIPYYLVDKSIVGKATNHEGYLIQEFWESVLVETTDTMNNKYFRVGHIKIKT